MSYISIGFKPGEMKKIKYIADMTGLTRTMIVRSILVEEFSRFDRENRDRDEIQMFFTKAKEEGKVRSLTVLLNDNMLEKMQPYLTITELKYSPFIRHLVTPVINHMYQEIQEKGEKGAITIMTMATNSNKGIKGDIE